MSRVRAVMAAAAAVGLLAGCGSTIEGTPTAAGVDTSNGEFRSLLQECETVTDEQIAQVVGGDLIVRGFLGAICRWDVVGATGPVKVTFDWFENGSMEVERAANEQLGWTVTDITVSARTALEIRQPEDPGSCGVTAPSPDVGVIGWWVQLRPESGVDACEAARTLMQLSLNLSA